MKSVLNYSLILCASVAVFACNNGEETLEQKKARLAELRTQSSSIKTEMTQLEKEISELDPDFGKNANNIILVTTSSIQPQSFEHKIEVRGTVESRKNVMISAEMGGRILTIRSKEGDKVKKGQILLTIDAEVIENNIEELKTSLELAEIVFQRQENLWEKKIGTEIQYLEAKNTKESLERRLATTKSQLAKSIVRAPFSGTIDEIPAKVGEMAITGMPLVRIVNPDDMYILTDISENYIGKFQKGESVEVHFPTQNKYLKSKISSVSQVINRENRTFSVELELPPRDFVVKPNQVTLVKLTDYFNENTWVLPTKIIQRDDRGNFIYAVNSDNGTMTASKVHIETGLSFNSLTEVVSGIQGNEIVIDGGFRDVTEGVEIRVATAQN